ncbi:MAG: pyruvate dehydrogenase subunit alpha [Hyphomicrobiales bacterium]|nr:pyruvate dehydrogenase subunit alpha [Hyphomicrobiales bacterium]
MLTYRYRGHSMSDPAKYRTRAEVDRVRSEQDPIEHVVALLARRHGNAEEALSGTQSEIRTLISAAADFSLVSPEPDQSELWTDVYAT